MGPHLAGSCHWTCFLDSVPGPVLLNIFISDLNVSLASLLVALNWEMPVESLAGEQLSRRDMEVQVTATQHEAEHKQSGDLCKAKEETHKYPLIDLEF